MLTLWFEGLAVGSEGIEDFFGLCAGDASQAGFDFFEAARSGLARYGFSELIEAVKGSSAFGFDESGVDRKDSADAVDLVVCDFKKRQACEGAHLFAVAGDAVLNRIAG